MSLIQWRNFHFFTGQEVSADVVSATADVEHYFPRLFKSLDITCMSHGRGHILAGDANGRVLKLDRDLNAVLTFPAYAATISHMHQLLQHNILLTVGTEEPVPSATPVLKAWNMDKLVEVGQRGAAGVKVPACLRTIRIQYAGEAFPVTACAVMENLSHVAIGLSNSVILLIKGDITRDRFTKQRVLNEENRDRGGRVISLAFHESPYGDVQQVVLYGATESSTFGYRWSGTGREVREFSDPIGARPDCVASTDRHDNIAVARQEAVYMYGPEGRGACFVLDGEKHGLWWHRNYAVVAGEDKKNHADKTLTVYDLKNKFIAFSETYPGDSVQFVVREWGVLHVFLQSRRIITLHEKDSASKMNILFKKNLYPLAMNLATSQHHDPDTVVDILKRYGDHLYSKGEFDAAMQQYRQTIGKLEPSYVIRKFLDAQRIHSLTAYLQALHEQGLATQDHTTLLLNCYTKLRDVQKLDEFIKTDHQVFFDVQTAINVCRSSGFFEHAVYMARKFNEHEAFIRIQLEDLKNYQEAISYISKLGVFDAERTLKKYGKSLITNIPEETTEFLIGLCTGGQQSTSTSSLSSEAPLTPGLKSRPEEFIQIFVNEPRWLIIFLERLIQMGIAVESSVVWNTLLELYLSTAAASHGTESQEFSDKAMRLFHNPDAKYDNDHALVLCKFHGNRNGVLFLYERMKLFKNLLKHHMENGDYKNVVAACKRFGRRDPELWATALEYFADNYADCEQELKDCINVLDKEKLMSPVKIIDILGKNSVVPLSVVQDFILRGTLAASAEIEQDERLIASYREETLRMKQEIHDLTHSAQVFQVTKCTACSVSLDLPAVHFLCKHSYHLRCLGDEEKECPKCAPEQRLALEIMKSQEANANDHDQFFRQLESTDDGFSVIADYLGRNTFFNLTG